MSKSQYAKYMCRGSIEEGLCVTPCCYFHKLRDGFKAEYYTPPIKCICIDGLTPVFERVDRYTPNGI